MTLKDASKAVYHTNSYPATYQEIQTGAIQRITEACESMAVNHRKLMADLEYYTMKYREQIAFRERAERQVSALRGVITRMKRRATP